jgi:serine/threonine kinase 38
MLKHLFSPPPIGGAQEEPEPELEPEPEPEQPRRLNVRPFPFDAVDAARAARRALGSSCAFVCCVLTSRCAGPQISDFEMLTIIGRGAFGEVRLVRKRDTGKIYAMKKLRKVDMVKKDQVAHVIAERDVLSQTRHDRVVKLYFSFQDVGYLYLIMEYLQGGDIMTLLMRRDVLTEAETRFYIAETALALESVHDLNYVHRDIKPDNIIIDNEGHIKLSDFGLCRSFEPTFLTPTEAEQVHGGGVSAPPIGGGDDEKEKQLSWRRSKREKLFSTVGTPDYIAPEILMKKVSASMLLAV